MPLPTLLTSFLAGALGSLVVTFAAVFILRAGRRPDATTESTDMHGADRDAVDFFEEG